jgi:hypothetical protein
MFVPQHGQPGDDINKGIQQFQMLIKVIQQSDLKHFYFLTPRIHNFNSFYRYRIPPLETSLRMALLRPKHVGGTLQSDMVFSH